jgi:hypothetical protein
MTAPAPGAAAPGRARSRLPRLSWGVRRRQHPGAWALTVRIRLPTPAIAGELWLTHPRSDVTGWERTRLMCPRLDDDLVGRRGYSSPSASGSSPASASASASCLASTSASASTLAAATSSGASPSGTSLMSSNVWHMLLRWAGPRRTIRRLSRCELVTGRSVAAVSTGQWRMVADLAAARPGPGCMGGWQTGSCGPSRGPALVVLARQPGRLLLSAMMRAAEAWKSAWLRVPSR